MGIQQTAATIVKDIVHLFYPKICAGCNTPLLAQEEIICLMCKIKLPRTNFELTEHNAINQIFWGRVPLVFASAFLYFRKEGLTQKLVHQLKYKNRKEVGIYLGSMYAQEIKDKLSERQIDIITTVPLHPAKLLKRGYNQSDYIAQGFAETLGISFKPNLIVRNENTSTQTLKKRYERWENMADKFAINTTFNVENKIILVVDDVITTGATMEACCKIILKENNVKVAVISLCYAVN